MRRHFVRFVGLLVNSAARILPVLTGWLIGKLS